MMEGSIFLISLPSKGGIKGGCARPRAIRIAPLERSAYASLPTPCPSLEREGGI